MLDKIKGAATVVGIGVSIYSAFQAHQAGEAARALAERNLELADIHNKNTLGLEIFQSSLPYFETMLANPGTIEGQGPAK